MGDEASRLAGELTTTSDVEQRREAVSRLRDKAFSGRHSLAKRGTMAQSAESGLTGPELDALHDALRDEDRVVRLNAIVVVGDLGDASSVPTLASYCEDDDREIRLAAIDSLGDIGGGHSTVVLTRLAGDSEEEADIRFAALTQLEELTAKRITSGPDRRFDPEETSLMTRTADEPSSVMRATATLLETLQSIISDVSADELLRLKAVDVRTYLESGVAQ